MQKNKWGLLALVFAGSFFISSQVFSANSDIVINEIGAYPTSTHEWIEIWNKGTESVDLTGWTFWENNTRHGLTATTTDSVVAPGEFAAIAQKSEQFLLDHPGFAGSIFGSTWSSLSTSGEEIGLDDASGVIIERFVYQAATQFSLERKNPFTTDYSNANWQQHATGSTLGFVNSNYVTAVGGTPIETATTTPVATSTPLATTTIVTPPATIDSSTTTTATSTTSMASNSLMSIKINEFVPNPDSGSEWVELYNTASSSIDLSGATICDNRTSGSCTIATLSETILPHGFVTVFFASGKLNNDGDSIILKDSSGAVIDMVRYGEGAVAVPSKGQAGARTQDGVDTNSDADFAITTVLTLGAHNVIAAPTVNETLSASGSAPSGSSQSSGVVTSFFDAHAIWVAASSSVVLNELLPNPTGSDEAGEFIELKNISDHSVNIQGWQVGLQDKLFSMTGSIDPFGLRILPRSLTGIILPNTTSTEVRLYTSDAQIADELVYSNAPSGQSYARDANGVWKWTQPTPNSENNFVTTDPVQPVWKTGVPVSGQPGQVLGFSAQKSVDPRGGALSFLWNFGDGSSLEGGNVEHVFLSSGVYSITLSATSTTGTHGEKKFVVRIAEPVVEPLSSVTISEVFADPEGADSDEFVEVYNGTATTTDLGGYRLQTTEENSFIIPPETKLGPEQFLVFYRLATHLDLRNSGGEVDLLSASGTLIDVAAFPKSASGQSMNREGATWQVTTGPTPGRFALASEVFVPEAPKKVLGTKIKKSTTKKVALAPVVVAFDDTEALTSGRPVIARGTVTAVPGVLGKQYFYLSTTEGGMQVYQSKKDFPPLEVGDVVEVRGKISIAAGVKRINIANAQAVDILDTKQGLAPQKLVLDDMGEENAGELVEVQGEITEITGSQLYVDDGTNDIAVYLHASAGIDKKNFKVRQLVRVTGILEQTEKGWRISPRSSEDMAVTGVAEDAPQAVAGEKIIASGSPKKYWIVTGVGVGMLGIATFVRLRKK